MWFAGSLHVAGIRFVALYESVVAVHVVAAVIGFGVTFAYPVIQVVAERRDPQVLAFAIGVILALSRLVAVPATFVVGVTGVYQVAAGPYELGDVWVAVGLGLYLTVMVLGIGYLARALAAAKREAERMIDAAPSGTHPALSPAYRAAMRGPRMIGPLVSVAIVVIVVLMVVKPD